MRNGNCGRRRVLAAVALAGASAFAGCAESSDAGGTDDGVTSAGDYGGGTGDAKTPSEGTSGGTDGGAETEDLDPREANVVDVSFEPTDGAYRFDVTLSPADGSEESYTDWWQVETLSGETLGRRKLQRSRGNEPFTSSKTIEVPDDVNCVVVRGHDQTHEYGGQVVIINLRTGGRTALGQGSSKESFVEYDC